MSDVQSISAKLDRILILLEKIGPQIEALYYDEEPPEDRSNKPDRNDYIRNYGTKIPYNLIDDPTEVADFKKFIFEAKTKFRYLTTEELKWVDVADKDFEDVRLSRKHITILQAIYPKVMGAPWPFHAKLGYMYKLGDRNKGETEQITWSWFG